MKERHVVAGRDGNMADEGIWWVRNMLCGKKAGDDDNVVMACGYR